MFVDRIKDSQRFYYGVIVIYCNPAQRWKARQLLGSSKALIKSTFNFNNRKSLSTIEYRGSCFCRQVAK